MALLTQLYTNTSSNQNITTALLVGTYTNTSRIRKVYVNVFADQVAGNGTYTCYATIQRAGAGSAYIAAPKTTYAAASGETALAFTSIPINLNSTDVLKIYVLGLAGDTTTPDIIVDVNEEFILTDSSGRVDAYAINSIAASSVTTINANVGTTQPVNFTGTGASALAKSDMVDVAGAAVSTSTAQLGVNAVQAGGTAWGSGAITAASIAADAITAAKVADGTIDAATFAAGAINAAAIAADAITDAKVASDVTIASVTGAVGSVTSRVTANTDQFAGQTITAAAGVTLPSSVASPTNITAGTITNVTTVNGLAAGVITAASIATDAITAAKIADGAIDAATFATDAITASALATSAITEIQTGITAPTVAQIDTQLSGTHGAGAWGAGGNGGVLTLTYTLTSSVDSTPIEGAHIELYAEVGMTTIIAAQTTDVFGVVTFSNLIAGTYYLKRIKSGWTFTNPDSEVVA